MINSFKYDFIIFEFNFALLICAPEQLEDEIIGVIALVRDLMALFGFQYRVVISTKPAKAIGSDEAWELATNALIKAVERANLSYTINAGDGAFYGPKIDVKVTDAIGREWQLSTIQCDFTLPERFELEYVGQDGERHRPVMVHRAILGSLERFIGVLTEHYAGAFPTWLAPVQAKILTVTDAQNAFAEEACEALMKQGIRAEVDTRNEKLGFKVREAQLAKIPYRLLQGSGSPQRQRPAAHRRKSGREVVGRSGGLGAGRLRGTVQTWRDELSLLLMQSLVGMYP